MSGVSGSGKSTYAKKLAAESDCAKIVSADNYFLNNGVYCFDHKKLGAAHANCFSSFIETVRDSALVRENAVLIVDNTNTTAEEISPYALGAAAYDCDFEIFTLQVDEKDLSILAERNSHGVSLVGIQNQYNRLKNRSLPPYWKNTNIPVGF
jgi:predicted kinase